MPTTGEHKRTGVFADWRLPFGILAAEAVVTVFWNALVGLQWDPATVKIAGAVAIPLGAGALLARWRKLKAVDEICFYLFLWILFPIAAIRLMFLAVATFHFPLEDGLLARADAALGFNWLALYRIVFRPEYINAESNIYMSIGWQPVLSIVTFAFFVKNRNREMLMAFLIASVFTAPLFALVPAIGPGHAYGITRAWDITLLDLEAGSRGPFPYQGIVTFPSFHTTMAVLFTLAHRGLPTLPIFVALNVLVLLTVPFSGDHYLCDMIAGAAVALASWKLACRWNVATATAQAPDVIARNKGSQHSAKNIDGIPAEL